MYKDYFRSPMEIELLLSGNFAEIRSDHFHSGIDIKTRGVTGQKVFATADGYISRIRIEAGGYGKSLYIAHPNGKTTVYGHLDRFREDINDFVRDQQYKRNSHSLNIYPERNEWVVKKGDIIAYSGNSGSSAGPHLHYEIRNTGNQKPENVLLYKLILTDTVAPRFLSLWTYSVTQDGRFTIPEGTNSFDLIRINGRYILKQKDPVMLNGTTGFGIEAFDFLNGANNKCGLYSIEMLLDDIRTFFMRMDDFSFNESRYVNSFMDYGEKQADNRIIQKLYLDPNNKLGMYKEVNGLGLVELSDADTHLVRIIIKDALLNTSELVFTVIDSGKQPVMPNLKGYLFRFDQDKMFDTGGVTLRIPAYSLYTDIDFLYTLEDDGEIYLSDIHHLHNPGVPLHSSCELAIRPVKIDDNLKEKATILSIDYEGKITFEGGEWKSGFVHAKVNHFGTFVVGLDTVPPAITPLNINENKDLTSQSSLRFRVVDNQSGIRSYDGYIDNQWVLFEYDAKNDLVSYAFDKKRLKEKTMHELELYIVDNKDNIAYFVTEFYW